MPVSIRFSSSYSFINPTSLPQPPLFPLHPSPLFSCGTKTIFSYPYPRPVHPSVSLESIWKPFLFLTLIYCGLSSFFFLVCPPPSSSLYCTPLSVTLQSLALYCAPHAFLSFVQGLNTSLGDKDPPLDTDKRSHYTEGRQSQLHSALCLTLFSLTCTHTHVPKNTYRTQCAHHVRQIGWRTFTAVMSRM